ncbi:MAG TPA: pyruvate ferredoxin oxidoreductase [Candidatus Dormibacteraeota bacterium]|nr:pyruvate ferredoxin oxidoreductase [Candidatus Dormibacteraeota bacterium]
MTTTRGTVTSPAEAGEREEIITGCDAVAQALRLLDVDVLAGYPIRPYDSVMSAVSKMIANGQMDAEFIVAESEHSQFEIGKHASLVGARSFIGSSGVGWMYGMEALVVTASLRLPVVALVGNRALDDPGAFGVEHNDALMVRDTGWLLYWVETAQEALDTTLLAYRVAEDPRVMLPCALSMDGAFLTHSQHIVRVPDAELVRRFVPPYDLGDRRFHPDNPVSIAPQFNEDWVMEARRQADAAMRRSRAVIQEASREFVRVFGRGAQDPFLDTYRMEDAEYALVGMGTVGMVGKVAVDRLREQGRKVGFVRIKWFRPFPGPELRSLLGGLRGVGIVDRDYSFGSNAHGGVLYTEVAAALYPEPRRPRLVPFIAGLGGREVSVENLQEMQEVVEQVVAGQEQEVTCRWIGVRGPREDPREPVEGGVR